MDNVLLISPDFFYYQDIIKKGFHDLNYDCEWYSDRPGTDFITKSLIRFSPKLMKNKSKRYLNNILLNTTNKKYKFIVVIMGEVLTEDFITQLKKAHSESKSIYVFWDTIANFSYGVKLAHLFDKVFTTDRIDAINYNFNFIPLFYNPYIDTSKKSIVYDYCFIGTIKHGKNKSINEIVTFLNVKFEKSFVYKYLQGKLVFLYYKIKYMNEFKEERINNYKYKKISLEKTINIFKQSKYIIDVPMNQQNAVTERCLMLYF